MDLKIEDLSENYYSYNINPITPIVYEPTHAVYIAKIQIKSTIP